MPLFEHLNTSDRKFRVISPVNDTDKDTVIRLASSPVNKQIVQDINSILQCPSAPTSNVLKEITSDNIPARLSAPNKISTGTRIKLQDLKTEDVKHILDPDVSKWIRSAISMISMLRVGQETFRKRNIFIDINEFFRDFIPEKLQYLDDSNCMEIVEALSKGYYQQKFSEMVSVVRARDVKRTARKSCNYDYLIPNKLKAKSFKVIIKRANVSANTLSRSRSSSVKSDKRKLARSEKV